MRGIEGRLEVRKVDLIYSRSVGISAYILIEIYDRVLNGKFEGNNKDTLVERI